MDYKQRLKEASIELNEAIMDPNFCESEAHDIAVLHGVDPEDLIFEMF